MNWFNAILAAAIVTLVRCKNDIDIKASSTTPPRCNKICKVNGIPIKEVTRISTICNVFNHQPAKTFYGNVQVTTDVQNVTFLH